MIRNAIPQIEQNLSTKDILTINNLIEEDSQTRFIAIEHFRGAINGSPLNLGTTSVGGSVAILEATDGLNYGVARVSCGTQSAASQRGAIANSTKSMAFGNFNKKCFFSIAPSLNLTDSSSRTFSNIGWSNAVSVLPSHGALIRCYEGSNYLCVTTNNGVSTVTDTQIAPNLNEYNKWAIEYLASNNSVNFYLNGNLISTHTTNIPTGSMLYVCNAARINASPATEIGMDIDYFGEILEYPNALF